MKVFVINRNRTKCLLNKSILFIFLMISFFFISQLNCKRILWERKIITPPKETKIKLKIEYLYDKNYTNSTPRIFNNKILIGSDIYSHEDLGVESNFYYKNIPIGLFLLDKKTGTIMWSFKKGSSDYILNNNRIFVASKEGWGNWFLKKEKDYPSIREFGVLYSLDFKTGKKNWQIKIDEYNLPRKNFMPGFCNNILVIGTHRKTYGINATTGEIKWTISYGFIGEPLWICNNNYILCKLYKYNRGFYEQGENLYVINPINGYILKKIQIKQVSINHLNLINDMLIVSHMSGYTAYNIDNLKIIWSYAGMELGYEAPPPVIYNNILYAHGSFGEPTKRYPVVLAIDIINGNLIWQTNLKKIIGTDFEFPPKIFNNNIYLPIPDKRLIIKFDITTGKILKEISTKYELNSPFAYDNGVIYYMSKHTIYAEQIEL